MPVDSLANAAGHRWHQHRVALVVFRVSPAVQAVCRMAWLWLRVVVRLVRRHMQMVRRACQGPMAPQVDPVTPVGPMAISTSRVAGSRHPHKAGSRAYPVMGEAVVVASAWLRMYRLPAEAVVVPVAALDWVETVAVQGLAPLGW